MARLWDKGDSVDEQMHRLTVGDDPILDLRLVTHDCIGSAAHAKMLAKQGLFPQESLATILAALSEIHDEGKANSFPITYEQEDVHTAIEARLTEKLGEAGKRIHAARSRNDQVSLALRLFMREQVLELSEQALMLCALVSKRFDEIGNIEIPGYTHMQPAMPSSFGLWLHAVYEALLERARDGIALLTALNRNPLGSGAGFGSSLPIDREAVATTLAFDGVQRSFIDVNNSRGRYESKVLFWAIEFVSVLEKWACDAMLFSSEEFGFISFPVSLTTGSSIMPQKRNPDLVELLRARPSRVRGAFTELQFLTVKLPSSYHRDGQYTKSPLIRGIDDLTGCIEMFALACKGFTVNKEACEQAMYPELYATYAANREVEKGVAFRDAYRTTAALVKENKITRSEYESDFTPVQEATVKGMLQARSEFATIEASLSQWKKRIDAVTKLAFEN